MSLVKSRDAEYKRCAALLSQLIGMDAETEERVYWYFLSIGTKNFFIHLESMDLPQEYIEKLRNIKSVLDMAIGKGGQV